MLEKKKSINKSNLLFLKQSFQKMSAGEVHARKDKDVWTSVNDQPGKFIFRIDNDYFKDSSAADASTCLLVGMS